MGNMADVGTDAVSDIAANGIWVYQMTKKGLAIDASIKGTEIYVDEKLNT